MRITEKARGMTKPMRIKVLTFSVVVMWVAASLTNIQMGGSRVAMETGLIPGYWAPFVSVLFITILVSMLGEGLARRAERAE